MRAIRTTISILALGLLAGSAVGVAAQDEPSMDGATVTGQVTFSEPLGQGQPPEDADGVLVGGPDPARFAWETSDPRLDGEMTRTIHWQFDSNSSTSIHSATYELVNDGGSWLGEGRGYASEADGGVITVVMSGRDGYEGLSAMVVVAEPFEAFSDTVGELSGVIFPRAWPEAPELPAAE